MKKTPNGRTPPKAKYIHINYENTDRKRRSEVLRSAENTEKTLKEFSNRPDIRKKQSNAKTTRALIEKRYQELKLIIANMQSSLFNQIIEYSNTHSAEESINHFLPEIRKWKDLHDEYDVLAKQFNSQHSSDYSDLFIDLSRNNAEFLMLSPTSIFARAGKSLPLFLLDESQLQQLQSKLEEKNLFTNPVFLKNYVKYFPDYINKITDINDIFYALSKKPEMYIKFKNCNTFSAMNNNIKNYKLLLSSAPKALIYMSDDEINFVANASPSRIGLVINRCPETITRLSNKFFDKYPPKQVFGTCTTPKRELQKKLEQYLPDYPTLKEYLLKFVNNSQKISHNEIEELKI